MSQTVYVSIGNSDDKLTQRRWCAFQERFHLAIVGAATQIYGAWHSAPVTPFQNACVAFEISDEQVEPLRRTLAALRDEYGQESIAWAVAPGTEFI